MIRKRQGPFLVTRKFFGKVYRLASIEYSRSEQTRAAGEYQRKGYSIATADAVSGSIGGDTEYAVYVRRASRASISSSIARRQKVEKEEKTRHGESLRAQKRSEKSTYIRSYPNRADAEYYAKAQNWAYKTNYYVRKEGNSFVVRRRR